MKTETCIHRRNKHATLQDGNSIYYCSKLGYCTEIDLGRKLLDGSLIPVCANCNLYKPPSPLIYRVKAAVDAAERRESGLVPSPLALVGMSSAKVRHLLNNLKANNYLEIGSWRGSTLIAAMYGNSGNATAIEDYSQFDDGTVKRDLEKAIEQYASDSITLLNQSIFTIPSISLPKDVDICFYDGNHGLEETRQAMWRVFPSLADEAIVLIDDTNFTGVYAAAKQGLLDCSAEILYEVNLPARFNGDEEQWWNGLGVFVIAKPVGPKVSAICLTYNLPERLMVLNEAVEAFLRQTWPNKELIIVNDDANTTIRFDHPQVKIINALQRFATLGDKYNVGCEWNNGEILCSWDDDDISLPWRMKLAVDNLNNADYFNPKSYWYNNGKEYTHEYQKNYCHNASTFRKTAWEKVGKYKSINCGQDADLDTTLTASSDIITVIGNSNPEETAYIYRWGDGLQHISGGDMDANYAANASKGVKQIIKLGPNWKQDYISITRKLCVLPAVEGKPIAGIKLTIGTACCNDYTGLHETLMALRMHDKEVLPQIEVVVIDNSLKDYKHCDDIRKLVEWTPGWKYIRYTEIQGTSAPRNEIFKYATGEAVVIIDSHVQFDEGVLQKLIEFYELNPSTMDLYHGPVLAPDGLGIYATEFKPGFRGLMNGQWHLNSADLERGQPFDIWGSGCGLLTCRRAAWMGFSLYQRGFAGEEGYIHAAFRAASRRVLCLPWLRWCHRWGSFSGISYGTIEDRIRNYIYSAYEVNEPTIEAIRFHFIDEEKKISSEQFEKMRAECAQVIIAERGKKGVGTELSKLLSWFGFAKIPNSCNCQLYSDAMDINGVEWCTKNKPTIIGWLKEEATNRGYPFVASLAEIALNRAIAAAS